MQEEETGAVQVGGDGHAYSPLSIIVFNFALGSECVAANPSPNGHAIRDRCMSDNDPVMQWFPRDAVMNHALEYIRGMRREYGTGLTMTRQRARRHITLG
jgi:hypothetical protein